MREKVSSGEEMPLMDQIRSAERDEIIAVLRQTKGNITKAASLMGMSRQSLSYRMKKYHLK